MYLSSQSSHLERGISQHISSSGSARIGHDTYVFQLQGRLLLGIGIWSTGGRTIGRHGRGKIPESQRRQIRKDKSTDRRSRWLSLGICQGSLWKSPRAEPLLNLHRRIIALVLVEPYLIPSSLLGRLNQTTISNNILSYQIVK